jgi:hypothetical protein
MFFCEKWYIASNFGQTSVNAIVQTVSKALSLIMTVNGRKFLLFQIVYNCKEAGITAVANPVDQ